MKYVHWYHTPFILTHPQPSITFQDVESDMASPLRQKHHALLRETHAFDRIQVRVGSAR
jgi:hypothetical protein